jgi:lipid-binding SYLF domain-containing protein
MVRSILAIALAFLITGAASAADPGRVEQQRNDIRKMRDEALAELYQKRPDLKDTVARAAGYAAFSNVGLQVVFFGGGGGRGLVVDNATGKEHFMRMAQATAGFGIGVKDFRVVFIFHDSESMNKFIYSGWEFGGEVEAAAKSGERGGAASQTQLVQRGIEVYQLTQAGVSASATLGGTKYWKDKDLN